MNRQGPRGIEWTDYTWNPMTGCSANHPYCYARRAARRWGDDFTPKFHPERLGEPAKLKKPSKIFVVSMGDIMDPEFRDSEIGQVIQVAADCARHTFQFLTRHPERYTTYLWPDNCWLGATATRAAWAVDSAGCLQDVGNRHVTFLSCEPWLEVAGCAPTAEVFRRTGLDWLIVGAQTGPGAVPSEAGSIERLIAACDEAGVPVFCKRSIHHICQRQEWPREEGGDAR